MIAARVVLERADAMFEREQLRNAMQERAQQVAQLLRREAKRFRLPADEGLLLVPGLLDDLLKTERDVRRIGGRWRIVQDEKGNPHSRRLEILEEDPNADH